MPVQWRTDYAVRLMYEAALLGPGTMATVQQLAESGSVPYDFARQIANELVRGGLMISQRGARGGVGLAKPAEEISLYDIFICMGERPTLSLCTFDPGVCGRTSACPVHNSVWRDLDAMIATQLKSATLVSCVKRGTLLLDPA